MNRWVWGLWILVGCHCADNSPETQQGNPSAKTPSLPIASNDRPLSNSTESASDVPKPSDRTVIDLNSSGEINVDGAVVPNLDRLSQILNAKRRADSTAPRLTIDPTLRWAQIQPILRVLGPVDSPIQFEIHNRATETVHPLAWWPTHPGNVANDTDGSQDHPFTFELNLRTDGLTIRHQSAAQEFHSSIPKAAQLIEHAITTNRNHPIPVIVRIEPNISWQTVLEITEILAPILDPGHLAIWHQSPTQQ